MPRKFFDKYLPTEKKIRKYKILKIFGETLYQKGLWDTSRKTIILSIFISLFIALQPIPFQMIIVSFLAIVFKFNLPISLLMVWITNPLTMPIIYYIEYNIGSFFLKNNTINRDFSIEFINNNFFDIATQLYIGSFIFGIIVSLIISIIFNYYWKKNE